MSLTETPFVEYEIDANDRIVRVNEAWYAEAAAGGEFSLQEPSVLGADFWALLNEPTTRVIYAALIERARTSEHPVEFDFRCDTPDQRRLMHMRIVATEGAGVTFSVSVIAAQVRQTVALLTPGAARSGELLRMCGWCKRVPLADGRWLEVEDAMQVLGLLDVPPLPEISHGICESCERQMMAYVAHPSPRGRPRVTLGPLPSDAKHVDAR